MRIVLPLPIMKNKRKIYLTIFFLLTLFITGYYFLYHIYLPNRANQISILDTTSLNENSYVKKEESIINFSLYKDKNYLYKTKSKGEEAVLEFLNNTPQYQQPEIPNSSTEKVKSASIIQVFPKNFVRNSFLIRKSFDSEDKFLIRRGYNINNKHFFYNQKINNIPVFGSILGVHVRNENEIYSLEGNLILDETIKTQKISYDQAKEIAFNKAREETGGNLPLKIEKIDPYILNLKLLGLTEDKNNYLTLAITINSANSPFFSKQYFVDLETGKVLFMQDFIHKNLNRIIYDCTAQNMSNGCGNPARIEGNPPTNKPEVDKAYDLGGNTYNYFSTQFQRDSYDNRGGRITVLTNISNPATPENVFPCPNAVALVQYNLLVFCSRMLSSDAFAHEYTHLITFNTAKLLYLNQSGAINEAISDIFGYALDPDDWTIGEETELGVIRDLRNPTTLNPPQPDRLFSPHYYCGTRDNGGVHTNSTIITKAFYLMTEGGDFNGCKITGIGKEKTLPVIYRALTSYLTMTSNFYDFYSSLLKSCSDLYQPESNECQQIKSALQATELDQQPRTSEVGPSCIGISRQPATCISSTLTPSPQITPTQTPHPTITLTPSPSQRTSVILKIKLRFQGISSQTSTPHSWPVKVTLSNPDGNKISKTGIFLLSENPAEKQKNIWVGTIDFDIPTGNEYTILIKGPKHVQKKICHQHPIESRLGPGSYSCRKGQINLTEGINNLDFSEILLLSGDIPVGGEQDGVVNSTDTSFIRNNLGSKDPSVVIIGDINLDGIIDTQDWSLIIASLSVKGDEE